ncbi:PIG-L deacetylase family protein [Pseudomonas sp. SLFW]|uniref:PIG-L deacetylase family protein n=1 Tax=Pseudomonas sp. SLFW TaxID=2683259 RepID=UPI00141279F8|nr:PIG-L family deacetylase [Pseudomonas sp. SLFW]NBB12583.1 PIG-L family deacetylase [Pseudomonas sp. SLFW]
MSQAQPFGVAGTPLSQWQDSTALRGAQVISLEALVPPGSRLVVLAPHPDDEVLACGGLLAAMAMAGREQEIQLISVTDGEGSHPGSSQWPQARLRAQRRLESEYAVAALGLDVSRLSWHRLSLVDGGVAEGSEALIALLSEDLRPSDVLLSTWRHDGHCDHEAVGHCAAQAAASTGATLVEVPIWAWHWAEPNDPRIPWEQARKLMLGDEQLARKRRAITSHASQLQTDTSTGALPVLDAVTLDRLLQPFELVFL